MNYIKEKVAYIHGLFDGLHIKDDAENKMFTAIIDALDAIADAIEDHDEILEEFDEDIADLYDAIEDIEDAVFDELDFDNDDLDDLLDDEFIEIDCPHCKDTIYLDNEMLASTENMICPNCNNQILPPKNTD